MNWMAFFVIAWIALGLDTGLRSTLELGNTGISPSFMMCFAVFVAMNATTGTALWSCMILGLLVDLATTLSYKPDGAITVLGPHAVGYVLAGQLVLTLRVWMLRRNPLSFAVLCCMAFLVANVVVVFLYTMRSFMGDGLMWNASEEVAARVGSSIYTALVGVLVVIALMPLTGLLGFGGQPKRFSLRRNP